MASRHHPRPARPARRAAEPRASAASGGAASRTLRKQRLWARLRSQEGRGRRPLLVGSEDADCSSRREEQAAVINCHEGLFPAAPLHAACQERPGGSNEHQGSAGVIRSSISPFNSTMFGSAGIRVCERPGCMSSTGVLRQSRGAVLGRRSEATTATRDGIRRASAAGGAVTGRVHAARPRACSSRRDEQQTSHARRTRGA
jgi:hypothetical protein